MKTGIIIQARMGSTRLPGKILLPLKEKSIIVHIVERAMTSVYNQHIVVATSFNESDDPLVHLLDKEGINYYRGSEEDVLSRYCDLINQYHFDWVIRLTGDNPLFDIDAIPLLMDHAVGNHLDYLVEDDLPYGAHVEVIKGDALLHSSQQLLTDSDREHVTQFIKTHPELYNVGLLKRAVDDSHVRITVDTADDYEKMKVLYDLFYHNQPIVLSEILPYLRRLNE